MSSISEELDNLEIATGTLIERFRKLRREHIQLQETYLELVKTIEQQKLDIEQEETTNKTKESRKTLYDKQEDHINTKQIINEMMREIDHCLLLLDERGETE
jgi:F420-0:gamma-glutamyl ligase-like protein